MQRELPAAWQIQLRTLLTVIFACFRAAVHHAPKTTLILGVVENAVGVSLQKRTWRNTFVGYV